MDPLQNPSSLYYLHPWENPGMILVTPALMEPITIHGVEEWKEHDFQKTKLNLLMARFKNRQRLMCNMMH